MAEQKRKVTRENFGAWVLKCDPHVWDLDLYLELGDRDITGWSVAQSYRTDLMRAGQPVVFWVSGPKKGALTFRGVWGIGRLTSGAKWGKGLSAKRAKESGWLDVHKASDPGYSVSTDIVLWDDPIPADVFMADPVLAASEIVRVQQQSNPAFLTKQEYKALLALRKSWVGRTPTVEVEPATVTARGAGFGTAEQNRKVEAAAMKAASKYYRDAGYTVRDVSRLNLGWDLTAIPKTTDEYPIHVEVKGVSGSVPRVLLTRNEYVTSLEDEDWELAVVTQALTKPSVEVYLPKAVKKSSTPFAWQADLS